MIIFLLPTELMNRLPGRRISIASNQLSLPLSLPIHFKNYSFFVLDLIRFHVNLCTWFAVTTTAIFSIQKLQPPPPRMTHHLCMLQSISIQMKYVHHITNWKSNFQIPNYLWTSIVLRCFPANVNIQFTYVSIDLHYITNNSENEKKNTKKINKSIGKYNNDAFLIINRNVRNFPGNCVNNGGLCYERKHFKQIRNWRWLNRPKATAIELLSMSQFCIDLIFFSSSFLCGWVDGWKNEKQIWWWFPFGKYNSITNSKTIFLEKHRHLLKMIRCDREHWVRCLDCIFLFS